MTNEELQKFRVRESDPKYQALKSLLNLTNKDSQDEYGIYSTGLFSYKGKDIIVNIEDGKWHVSIHSNHILGYHEIKELRYKFIPNAVQVAVFFPPREEFVNVDKTCFHLWEL